MKRKKNTTYPKVSIITCVYNGEKYISKLLDSVLNMGYPNVEHIIVNDGSTDSTEDIVMKYAELYKNKENSNLYIKYIKQENMGLGGATNTGLKQITGEYWTWINCDDWYEKEAFFEPVEMLIKKPKLDYVQMNGYYNKEGIGKESTIIDNNYYVPKRKEKLFLSVFNGSCSRVLLFICRTNSYKKVCPSMRISPSRYTQDIQFISQIYGTLNGGVVIKPKWHFFIRKNSFYHTNKESLNKEWDFMVYDSIDLLSLNDKQKTDLKNVIAEERLLINFKKSCKKCADDSFHLYKQLRLIRSNFSYRFKMAFDKKIVLYLLYYYIVKCLKNIRSIALFL